MNDNPDKSEFDAWAAKDPVQGLKEQIAALEARVLELEEWRTYYVLSLD